MEKTTKEMILEHLNYLEKQKSDNSFRPDLDLAKSQVLIALAIIDKE